MKKFVTKFAAISMATMMAVSMVGCSTGNNQKQETTESVSLANPVKETTREEMMEETGIDLPAPEGATDVTYSLIAQEDGESSIAQMNFTLNGEKMYLRACSTSITSLNLEAGEDADVEDLLGFDMEKGNISGLNYKWSSGGTNMVQDRDAIVNVSKEGAGYIAWLDVVPGILYNLCMEENADMDKLVDTANAVFVPMQDEVDADPEFVKTEFADLLNEIYETKAGSAGSGERVVAAGEDFSDFVMNNAGVITAQNIEALATETFAQMSEEYGDVFADNFTECFDAVVDEVLSQNPDLETDVAFAQVVNGVRTALEGIK